MKKTALLCSFFFSASAMATDISFTYFGNEGNRQNYYACSYVEGQVESYLELLGATQVAVRCTGGIQTNWYASPVSVRASYTLPEVTGQGSETIEIQGDAFNPACGLNVRIIKEILKTMTNVQVLKKQDACAFATSNYYYKLNIAR